MILVFRYFQIVASASNARPWSTPLIAGVAARGQLRQCVHFVAPIQRKLVRRKRQAVWDGWMDGWALSGVDA